jgi:hypothetical protein
MTKSENYVTQRDPINTEYIIDLVRKELVTRLQNGFELDGSSLEAEYYWLAHNRNCNFTDLIQAIAGTIENAVLKGR